MSIVLLAAPYIGVYYYAALTTVIPRLEKIYKEEGEAGGRSSIW